MKFIRGFCSFVLQVILINLVILFGLSFGIKDLFGDFVYQSVSNNVFEDVASVDSEKFNYLLKLDDGEQFVKDISNDLVSNQDNNFDIEEKIISLLKENRDVLEKEYNVTFTDEEIKTIENELRNSNLNEEYVTMKKDFISSMDKEERMILDVYNFIVSSTFKIILVIGALVSLLFVALLQMSYYKWIRAFGVVSILSGILGTIIGVVIDTLFNDYLEVSSFVLGLFTKYSIGLIVIGILCIVIYIIISNKLKNNNLNKELKNEVSEVC